MDKDLLPGDECDASICWSLNFAIGRWPIAKKRHASIVKTPASFVRQGEQKAAATRAGWNVPNWLLRGKETEGRFLTWLVGRTHTENHGPHLYAV
jgi:hypothetical protein